MEQKIQNKETRHIEIRVKPESRTIEGYALKFNTLSEDLGGFYETILPGSLDGVLERSDVLALFNHSAWDGVLARSYKMDGSLKLEVDGTGLRYEFEAPDTQLGNELLESIKRKDVRHSSFAFTVSKQKIEKKDGKTIRSIVKFDELFDVSPVYFPAYQDTSVAKRSIEDDKNIEQGFDSESYYKQLNSELHSMNIF